MAAKKTTGRKSTAKKSTARKGSTASRKSGTARKSTARKSTARKSTARRSTTSRSSRATTGLDKSVENFRESLERSLTLSRDRVQEVMDDAVRRGRMQRKDAEKVVSDLVSRSRKQRDAMLKDLEKLVNQARKEVSGRATPVRKSATSAALRARHEVDRAGGRTARAVRDAADPALAQADRLRRRAGVSGSFPITAYDQLTAAQVKTRISDLTPAELRKVRDYEKRNQGRKGVISNIEKKLG
jgi:polyhydroxyalkanoate synthesis regulator phasin